MSIGAYYLIILLALAGWLVSLHIWQSKKRNRPLTCPLKSDCNAVVTSDFSRLLGIPLELLGLLYYGLTIIFYSLFIALPAWQGPAGTFILLVATAAAFLFSIYLTLVQALAIREWCLWCLISAGLCTAIFATAILGGDLTFADMLTRYREYIVTAFTIGLTLGVGASTVYNVLYLKSLRDLKISQAEQDILRTISQIIWLGLIVIIVSGITLYVSNPDVYNQSMKFITSLLVMGVIVISDALLNILVAPQLIDISAGRRPEHRPGELRNLRRLSFGLSAASAVSWYTILALALLPLSLSSSLPFLILSYLTILVIGIISSQLMEYSLVV